MCYYKLRQLYQIITNYGSFWCYYKLRQDITNYNVITNYVVTAIAWFETNYMKRNSDKCHLLVSGNKNRQMWVKLDRNIVWESNDVKLLGITLNNELKFDQHVSNICSKGNRKLSTLTRVAKFLPFKKRLILFKAFTKSQFKY